jgi:hypothetical protein
MINRTMVRALTLGIATLPLLVGACSSSPESTAPDPSIEQPVAEVGTLALPLVAYANGNTYRIALNMQFYGPQWDYIYADPYGNETELTRTLYAGNYQAYVSFWQLYLEEADGALTPVSSTLVSNYFFDFSIQNNTTSTITLEFETDGVRVTAGYGNLVVDVNVTEVAPVCTALGTDCGPGYWCPPAELTGQQLACIYETGSGQVGDSCQSPVDCSANTSCFDFGSGAVCGALCLAADFGNACATGGTCTPQGVDYGVCVPDGGTPPTTGGSGPGPMPSVPPPMASTGVSQDAGSPAQDSGM